VTWDLEGGFGLPRSTAYRYLDEVSAIQTRECISQFGCPGVFVEAGSAGDKGEPLLARLLLHQAARLRASYAPFLATCGIHTMPVSRWAALPRDPFWKSLEGRWNTDAHAESQAHSNPSNDKEQTVGQDDCAAAWNARLVIDVVAGWPGCSRRRRRGSRSAHGCQ
jgi:hypothetical protein